MNIIIIKAGPRVVTTHMQQSNKKGDTNSPFTFWAHSCHSLLKIGSDHCCHLDPTCILIMYQLLLIYTSLALDLDFSQWKCGQSVHSWHYWCGTMASLFGMMIRYATALESMPKMVEMPESSNFVIITISGQSEKFTELSTLFLN